MTADTLTCLDVIRSLAEDLLTPDEAASILRAHAEHPPAHDGICACGGVA